MRLPLQFPSVQRLKARIKSCPEDFQVCEVHNNQPGDQGDFAVVEVAKRNLTTPALLRTVAEHFQLSRDQVACAGYKDRLAVTRQRLSLPAPLLHQPPPVREEILEWRPLGLQPAPLRPGQLSANHFRIRLRGIHQPADLETMWQRQQPVGFANYYGIQRFGPDNENWTPGLEMLRNPPERRLRKRWPHNFVLNSVQSQLFNRFLEDRIQRGHFQLLKAGDWCDTIPASQPRQALGQRHEQERLQRFEWTILGPIWGYKLVSPSDTEQALLQKLGLTSESFRPFRAPGSRRATRLPLPQLEMAEQEGDLVLSFHLPPGSYATVLLSHFFELEGGQDDSGT